MATSRYSNLPRIEFTTLDGQLIALGDRARTESVLIVAPAVDGPTDRILSVSSVGDVETVFGPVVCDSNYLGPNGETSGYNGNALIKALREVQGGGAGDVRLLRVGGTQATASYTNNAVGFSGAPTGTLTAAARFGGRIYNQCAVAFTSGATSGQVVITQPATKGGALTLTWTGANSGMTVGDMIDRINAHPSNTTTKLKVGTISPTGAARLLSGTMALAGGTDGTIKDDLATIKTALYNAIAGTGGLFDDMLADYECDVVYLAGIYLDDMVDPADATKSMATDFSKYLARRSADHPMIGVIGVRPLNDFSDRSKIAAHYAALINPLSGTRGNTNDYWSTAGYFMKAGFLYQDGTLEQPVDGGAYLQVVAGDVIFSDTNLNLYIESAAGVYAGTIAGLRPQLAATYKPVNGIFGLPYEFTRAQLDTLVAGVGRDSAAGIDGGGAYVTLRRLPNRGTLFVRDTTAALRNSDFKDLQPLRIANAAHKGIKDICFPFLGQPNDIAHRQALTTQIKSFLDGMADAGALLGKDGIGYALSVLSDSPMNRLMGIIEIDLTLRPALQIKAIKVRVRMSL